MLYGELREDLNDARRLGMWRILGRLGKSPKSSLFLKPRKKSLLRKWKTRFWRKDEPFSLLEMAE